jgi:hypothetical protein
VELLFGSSFNGSEIVRFACNPRGDISIAPREANPLEVHFTFTLTRRLHMLGQGTLHLSAGPVFSGTSVCSVLPFTEPFLYLLGSNADSIEQRPTASFVRVYWTFAQLWALRIGIFCSWKSVDILLHGTKGPMFSNPSIQVFSLATQHHGVTGQNPLNLNPNCKFRPSAILSYRITVFIHVQND